MNLLLYFCVPLVVTGQFTGSRGQIRQSTEKDAEGLQTSETELYSPYEYGSHVEYKNDLDDFAVGSQGLYYRKNPASIEDSGDTGRPNLYAGAQNGEDNDHPSFAVSNIYSFIRNKKNNSSKETQNTEGPARSPIASSLAYGAPASPLAYGAPAVPATPLAYGAPASPLAYGAPAVPGTPLAYGAPATPLAYGAPATPLAYGAPGAVPGTPLGYVPSSPLAYGAPAPPDQSAIVINGHSHKYQIPATKTKLSPILQQAPLISLTQHHPNHQQQVLLHDPYTGQLVHAPLHHNGLTPLYQSQVTPQLIYLSDGRVISQQVPLTQQQVILKTGEVPLHHHHQQLIGKTAPVHEEVLVKSTGASVYQAPLLKTGIAAAYHAHHTSEKGHLHEIPQHYQPPTNLIYHDHVLKSSVPSTPLLKAGPVPLYPYPTLVRTGDRVPFPIRNTGVPTLLRAPDGTLYQTLAPHLKTAAAAGPLLLKSQIAQLYQTPVLVHPGPQTFVKEPVVPLYKQPILNDAHHHSHEHAIKTTQHLRHQHTLNSINEQLLLKAPLVKSPGVEASILPAIEETLPVFEHTAPKVIPNLLVVKQPGLTPFISSEAIPAPHNHPNVFVQKAVLKKSPVFTEKAVLKAALTPVYSSPHGTQQAIIKAPLLKQFVQHGYLEHDLPTKILSSQKSLVSALIATDGRKLRGGKTPRLFQGATNLEVVPSLSYAYSFSQYPRPDGQYGPPQRNHKK